MLSPDGSTRRFDPATEESRVFVIHVAAGIFVASGARSDRLPAVEGRRTVVKRSVLGRCGPTGVSAYPPGSEQVCLGGRNVTSSWSATRRALLADRNRRCLNQEAGWRTHVNPIVEVVSAADGQINLHARRQLMAGRLGDELATEFWRIVR